MIKLFYHLLSIEVIAAPKENEVRIFFLFLRQTFVGIHLSTAGRT